MVGQFLWWLRILIYVFIKSLVRSFVRIFAVLPLPNFTVFISSRHVHYVNLKILAIAAEWEPPPPHLIYRRKVKLTYFLYMYEIRSMRPA